MFDDLRTYVNQNLVPKMEVSALKSFLVDFSIPFSLQCAGETMALGKSKVCNLGTLLRMGLLYLGMCS